MLNSVDRFAAPAATPILLNLFLIAALLLMARFGWHDGAGAGLGGDGGRASRNSSG